MKTLMDQISVYQDSIHNIKVQLWALEDSLETIEAKNSKNAWVKAFKVKVYRKPNFVSHYHNATIYKGAGVTLIDSTENYYKIKYLSGLYGYVGDLVDGYVPAYSSDFSDILVSRLSYREIKAGGEDPKKDKYTGLPDKLGNAIRSGEVYVGMERKWVIESWGHPNHINKTTNKFGVHEQFVYEALSGERKYLYIENGILTTIQE